MSAVHLVPSVEEFTAQVKRDHGPDAVLHPSNRLTKCGRHGGSLDTTTDPSRVTCKRCAPSTEAGL